MIVRGPWLVRAALGAAGAVTLAVTAAGFFSREALAFELLAQFRVQLLAAAATLFLFSVFAGSRWASAIAAFALAANVGAVWGATQAAVSDHRARRGEPVITVVWANLQENPRALARVAAMAAAEQADLVALTELPLRNVAEARAAFPGFECATPVTGGVNRLTTLILSRQCEETGQSDLPSPSDVVWLEAIGLRLVAAHPIPPLSSAMLEQRDAAIAAAVALRALDGPTLMVGDFNATPYTHAFDGATLAGLSRARCGGPFVSTWRSRNPLFGLHIDHAFVSSGLRLVECRVGAWNGSDHAPLIVRVQRS